MTNFYDEIEKQLLEEHEQKGDLFTDFNADDLQAEANKELEEAQKQNPHYIGEHLAGLGYYNTSAGIYCPLQTDNSNDVYYLRMWRQFPKGASKQTYYYGYYNKETDTPHPRPFKSQFSIYDYNYNEDFTADLNKYLGHTSNFVADNGGEGFVTDNLARIVEDINNALAKGEVIGVLSDDYQPSEDIPADAGELVEEQPNPLVQKKKIEKSAKEFITELKELDTEPTVFLKYRASWLNAGELNNTIKGFICHFATYMGVKAVNFIPVGKTAEGKSVIYDSSRILMPSDAFVNGRKTEAVIYRLSQKVGEDYLNNSIMEFGDLGGTKDLNKWEESLNICKELNTEGKCQKEITGDSIDKDTGEKNLLNLNLKGYASTTFTTVNTENIDAQIVNRGLTVTPNSSNEDVKQFNRYNKGKYKTIRNNIINVEIGKKFHNYIRWLKLTYPYDNETKQIQDKEGNVIDFINPYYLCFEDWVLDSAYFKRNSNIYEGLINAVTLLNSPFRESITTNDGVKYFIVGKDDINLISDLLNPALELSPLAVKLYNKLIDWYGDDPNNYNVNALAEYDNYNHGFGVVKNFEYLFTVSTVRKKARNVTNLKNTDIGQMLNNLASDGKIEVIGKATKSSANIYGLVNDFKKVDDQPIKLDQYQVNLWCEEIKDIYSVEVDAPNVDADTCTKMVNVWELPKWNSNPGI